MNPNAKDFRIREATTRDLPAIARLHRAAYSEAHFTSRLSAEALSAYYGLFLGGGSQITVLTPAAADDELLGFAVFGRGIPARIAHFKRDHRVDIGRAALRHPFAAANKLLSRFASAMRSRSPVQPSDYLLLSIAVGRPGIGTGGRLLDDVLERARAANEEIVGLYVNFDNVKALNSYISRHFHIRDLQGGQYYMEATTKPKG